MFSLRAEKNALEGKDMFVFVDKVDDRDFLLDDIPPKHG